MYKRGLICFFVVILLLIGCNTKNLDSRGIFAGVYTLENKSIYAGIYLILEDDKNFIFSYSPTSSYLPFGTYSLHNDQLVLRTEDNLYSYFFQILPKGLVFDKGRSSEIPTEIIQDGSLFVYTEAYQFF